MPFPGAHFPCPSQLNFAPDGTLASLSVLKKRDRETCGLLASVFPASLSKHFLIFASWKSEVFAVLFLLRNVEPVCFTVRHSVSRISTNSFPTKCFSGCMQEQLPRAASAPYLSRMPAVWTRLVEISSQLPTLQDIGKDCMWFAEL